MKKLLILTYYFPPLGLGGTQRVAKFVKYLPQFGWRPTVVTVKPIAYWALDESLMQDVKEARIIRTESLDPQRLLARLGRTTIQASAGEKRVGVGATINQKLLPFFLTPDSKILWRPFALRAVKKLLKNEHFDALLTTSPPHSVHLIGRGIAKKYRLPWLADFRDNWAGSHIVHEPTAWHFKNNQRLQRRVVKGASAVTCISAATRTALAMQQSLSKFHVLANGFDAQDFESRPREEHDGFFLCYSGTINRFADPAPFLDALALLRKYDPALYKKMTVQFVGYDTLGNFQKMVHERGLNRVKVIGHKPHDESVAWLQNADALLLIAWARQEDTFIPGKTFEYFGAQKPIFAISTSAPTNELLVQAENATVVESFEPKKIYHRLREFLSADLNCIKVNDTFVQQFERRLQTKQFAEILNSISKRTLHDF